MTIDPRASVAVYGPRPDLEYALSFCRCCPEVSWEVYPECYHWHSACEFGTLLEMGDAGAGTFLANGVELWLLALTGYTRAEFIAEFGP